MKCITVNKSDNKGWKISPFLPSGSTPPGNKAVWDTWRFPWWQTPSGPSPKTMVFWKRMKALLTGVLGGRKSDFHPRNVCNWCDLKCCAVMYPFSIIEISRYIPFCITRIFFNAFYILLIQKISRHLKESRIPKTFVLVTYFYFSHCSPHSVCQPLKFSFYFLSQRTFHYWWQRHPEADNHQWPAGGSLCWWDIAPGPGLSVHRQTRRRYGVVHVHNAQICICIHHCSDTSYIFFTSHYYISEISLPWS